MRLAVIGHTGRVARNRHRHFVRDRRDFQLAFALGDLVVVRLRIAVQHVGELVIARANIRLASRHVVRRAFAVRKAVAAYRHLAVRQRRAVVDLLIRSGGQRHFALLDFELAVLNNKRHIREVAVLVLELALIQTHGISARVSFCHGIRTGELEISRRVQRIAGRHVIALSRMLLSIILRFGFVSLDRHRHRVRDRLDFQLAFALGDRVVARLRIAVQLVGERVIARANVRLRARHLVRRAFAISKAVAAYRHLAVRQRRAVVDLLIRSGGQRHFALLDFELAVRRLRNDIFLRPVYLANGLLREFHVILSSIRSRRTNGDCAEISAIRRTGKAGNALLASIISLRVAVRRQLDVLIIVEIDYVIGRVSLNLDRLRLIRYRRVARNRVVGECRHGMAERLSSSYRICNFSRCSVQIIVYRVSGSVLFIVERQLALVFFEIDGLLFRVTIYKIERIEIFLQGIRRCDLFGVLPHKACLFIRMNQFFSIIIDIFDRINGRKLFNINRSVHVPCIRSRLYIIIRAIVNIEFRPCNLA